MFPQRRKLGAPVTTTVLRALVSAPMNGISSRGAEITRPGFGPLEQARNLESCCGTKAPSPGRPSIKIESRILTWSEDSSARLWDTKSGKQVGPSFQHGGPVSRAAFNAAENLILTCGFDNSARLWDARTGNQLSPSFRHGDKNVNGAMFTRDEKRVLTWGGDGTAKLWLLDADLDFPVQHLTLWVQAVTGSEYDLVTGKVRAMDTERWRAVRDQYEIIAAEHARGCKYKESNHWLRWN